MILKGHFSGRWRGQFGFNMDITVEDGEVNVISIRALQ